MPIIKRYANRKLYDTHANVYVTLQDLAAMVQRGEDVGVLDHATGEDITSQIQAQIIFELERQTGSSLPNAVLATLIQERNQTFQQLRATLLPFDAEARLDSEIERRMMVLVENGDLSETEAQVLLEKLLAVQPPPSPADNAKLKHALEKRGVPTRHDLEQLAAQVQNLEQELEALQPKPRTKRVKK